MRKTAAAVIASVLAAGTVAVSVSAALPAYASSPEFARSAEEWAALKDNKMEYWEIEGLIQEYNPTVQQNQYSYVKFRRDYGDTVLMGRIFTHGWDTLLLVISVKSRDM